MVVLLSAALFPLSAVAATYTIKSGDTLYAIARKNNTTVSALQKNNNLKGTLIFPGQKLNISAPKENISRGAGFSDVRKVLGKALSLLGSRYVYGARGPGIFDCSGFTSYVFKTIGFNLPHNAAAQSIYGKPVSKAELLPGDLVFFSYYGNKGINHVGIYTGNNQFIHASSTKGVIYSSLRSVYYRNNYRGARRVLF